MDQTNGPLHSGIPRLSRLPQPRKTAPSNAPGSIHASKPRGFLKPRPSVDGLAPPRTVDGVRPSGTVQGLQYTNGSASQQSKPQPTTPLEADAVQPEVLEAAVENTEGLGCAADLGRALGDFEGEKQKRRPRPSLSERTLDTLSQIPPSPSPSRRRPSIVGNTSNLRPPGGPTSSLRSPRSNLDLRAGSVSPSKVTPPLPPFTSNNDEISTPSKSRTVNSRLATPRSSNVARQFDMTKSKDARALEQTGRGISHATKAKTLHNPRTGIGRGSTARPSLASVFKDPQHGDTGNGGTSMTSASKERHNQPARIPDRSTASRKVSAPTTSIASKPSSARTIKGRSTKEQPSDQEVTKPPPKSSLTLRETIAMAKAAKREAAKQNAAPISANRDDLIVNDTDLTSDEMIVGDVNRVLERRIESAVISGFLNIAALKLKTFPEAVLKMYDFDQNSKIKWSEAVDVTKLIAADNELSEIPDIFFPDWSRPELEQDDDKSNQFAGLQTLDFRANHLECLPIGVRRLSQLTVLNLSNNRLVNDVFDVVCQIHSLKDLKLANNNLQGAIPQSIEHLSELQTLDLHGNKLSLLPEAVSSLEKLQRLDLSDNAMETLKLELIPNSLLVELNLSKNSLSGILFTQPIPFVKLQSLDVAFNRLQSLANDPLDFPKLQTLACDNNQLTTLPDLSRLESLTTLTAADNKIENLPDGFVDLNNLRNVNLSVNEIKTVDPLVAAMEHLTTLNITANPLRDRKYLAMNTADLKVDLAKRLVSSNGDVDTGANDNHSTSGQDVLSTSSGYTYKPENGVLNLSGQSIASVDLSAIDLTQPVHTVRLSNNALDTFPIDLLAHPAIKDSLKSLDISHNQSLHPTAYLTSPVTLPMLQSLFIVSTGITSLETLTVYLSAPSLRELNISCHRMTGPVPSLRAVFPEITTLLATDNWFTSIDVDSVRGLEVIDVSNNDIDHLPPKLGELGNLDANRATPGRLRAFACQRNKFRVPRLAILEKGTEAILKDLRRRVPSDEAGDEWRDE